MVHQKSSSPDPSAMIPACTPISMAYVYSIKPILLNSFHIQDNCLKQAPSTGMRIPASLTHPASSRKLLRFDEDENHLDGKSTTPSPAFRSGKVGTPGMCVLFSGTPTQLWKITPFLGKPWHEMAMFSSYQRVSIIYNMLYVSKRRTLWNHLETRHGPAHEDPKNSCFGCVDSPPFVENTNKTKIHESTEPLVLPGLSLQPAW